MDLTSFLAHQRACSRHRLSMTPSGASSVLTEEGDRSSAISAREHSTVTAITTHRRARERRSRGGNFVLIVVTNVLLGLKNVPGHVNRFLNGLTGVLVKLNDVLDAVKKIHAASDFVLNVMTNVPNVVIEVLNVVKRVPIVVKNVPIVRTNGLDARVIHRAAGSRE